MTFEEFERLPDQPGKRELLEGELSELPPAELEHNNIAHQIGYFETIGGVNHFTEMPARIAAVTIDAVAEAARDVLVPFNRTIGWFDPL